MGEEEAGKIKDGEDKEDEEGDKGSNGGVNILLLPMR